MQGISLQFIGGMADRPDVIGASLSLMRRLPPNKVEQNLTGLTNLLPDETDELLQRIDQPLEEATDTETGRKYLMCDYNRDGDSHRSPCMYLIHYFIQFISFLFNIMNAFGIHLSFIPSFIDTFSENVLFIVMILTIIATINDYN